MAGSSAAGSRAALARGIASCLHRTGCCVVRDPRVQPRYPIASSTLREDAAACQDRLDCHRSKRARRQLESSLVVKFPSLPRSDQSTFLDMMERYFRQSSDVKLRDARPELHYQVGSWARDFVFASCRRHSHVACATPLRQSRCLIQVFMTDI